jgi:hypothetical protein
MNLTLAIQMIAQMMAVHMLIHPTKEIMAPLAEAFGHFIKLSR